jgi:hypothetical protein
VRPVLGAKIKTDLKKFIDESDNAKFLKFKLSTTAVGGNADMSDQSVKYFGLGDLLISSEDDEYSVFPSLKIKDDVHILGNYFSTNYNKVKSYTKLELKVDMLEVYRAAQLKIED